MKTKLPVLLLLLTISMIAFSQTNHKRDRYKGLPVLQSNKDTISVAVGEYRSSRWIISPQLEQDSLPFGSLRPLEAKFITDVDSVSYVVSPGESKHFYVRLKNQYAHTVISNTASWSKLSYIKNSIADTLNFFFDRDYQTVAYYKRMKQQYPVDSVIAGSKDDAERVLRLLHWAHMQWKHNGNQAPQKSDAISILEEAKTGKGFPCFAYAEVLRAALNSVGIPTRRLALKTKNVETDPYASGHVVNEAWLPDQKKWVFIDPQEDIMPYYKGQPLNAVEFQRAVTRFKNKVELKSMSPINVDAYFNFVYAYLYYFDSGFDQRYNGGDRISFAQKSSMMLVPRGSKNPTKAGFYNNQSIDYCIYTNCIADFYKAPVLK
jgi:hypothetical protein